MAQAYVIKRKTDGKFRKRTTKRNTWEQRKLSSAQRDADEWTPDLQKARTYTNLGGAANALPYQADKDDYEFLPVFITTEKPA